MELARAIEIREKMIKAEDFIIAEAKKIKIDLTREQACIFANAVLNVYDPLFKK